MSNENLAPLSSGARSVLSALFFRGALQSGDIPSKAGALELRDAGLAHTQHTLPRFDGEDYFTFLTAKGQKLAIQYLAKTNFGKAKDKPGMDELRGMQEAIADSLDDMKQECVKAWDLPVEGKTPVIFLLDRYVAIGGKYTPEEMIAAVEHIQAIRSSEAFGKAAQEASPFYFKGGQAFIKDAFIGNGITTERSLMKVKRDENGCLYAAGMDVDVEGGKEQVAFKAEKFEVKRSGTVYLKDAVISAREMKTRLSDDMREAVIDTVRESDLFKSLQASLDAQASSQVTMQLKISQAVTDAIRNALKNGGLLSGKR